jgi:hypothetical protein
MIDDPDVRLRRLRWGIYILLTAIAVGSVSGRLLAVNSADKIAAERNRIKDRLQSERQRLTAAGREGDDLQREMAGIEARIRRELAVQRPFLSANDRSRWLTVRSLVEHGTYEIDAVLDAQVWDTIDKVQHIGRDGRSHFYSSKPPLLATLIAGPYWLIHRSTGWTLGDHPYAIGRTMLWFINVLPLALLFIIIAALAERFGATDLGRIFVVATATFGTFLNTFAVVLNNHVVAAVSAAVALYAVVRIICDGEQRWKWFSLAGLAAAFTAANELPALAFLVGVGLLLAWRAPRATLLAFLPPALLVAAAFFATNWIAHEDLRPPYMHRDWYDYDGSYWNDRQGIDIGEPSRAAYALHVLVGHHGVFSLTPVWLLSMAGAALWLLSSDRPRRELAALVLGLTITCLVFYIGLRPQEDRNYGGMTSGFRWMFWFVPLWLLVMIPAADRLLSSVGGLILASLLLAMSVLAASYPTWNPWSQPWIYDMLQWWSSA